MEENCKSIKVYGRIKPYDDSKGSELIEYDIYDRVSVDSNTDCLRSKIVFNHKPSGEAVNNKAEQQTFRFCKVFDQDTQQWEIYEVVAKPVVDSVLEGYNGTVFAYGQTGSGKTYSITGGPDKYEDRGIIPRSIQQIFEAIRLLVADIIATVFISYCEIYNETGYDLLDAAPKARKKLEDLPRVSISEDLHGNFHFRNLSLKKVETEEEALNLLFLGDSNRVTAETPMNKTSSRSHCVFTIVLATRSVSSGIVRRSKLNLVDLAGSERVSKTGVNGKTLEEAKNINLSLHFLEQVIVALNTPDCKHIPYRNSIMTIVLKDSLGGNCLTTMLATLSAEQENIWETISTCRFAQRVALIKNEVYVNEELDPLMEVKILKEDIKALRKQLSLVGAPSVDVELTPDEIGECQNLVQQILSKENMDSMPQIPTDLRKINHCAWLLKCAVADAEKARNPDVKELVGLLREREEEIASLRGATGPSTDDNLASGAGACPPSQSASARTYRPRAGSALSGRSRPRGSQQLDEDRDIVSRVEANVRRFGDLRSLLETTRCVQGGDEMDEFIASVIHQIHDEERDYRMLLAMHNNQQTAEQYNPQAVEDLLVEQIEISKLKMLFDFRNLYQERLRTADSKTGNGSFDQRSGGGRSPRKNSNQGAGTGRSLPTLEETSSNLMNLPNAAGVESLSTCQAPVSNGQESPVSVTTKQSIVMGNKTDISLENASVRLDEAPSSRKGSTVSSATRRTSGFSTEPTVIDTLNEIACAGSEEERSSSRKGSAVSSATRRTSGLSTVPTVIDTLNEIACAGSEEERSSSRKGSAVSSATRRTSGLSTVPTVIDTLNEIACAGSEEERSSSRKGSAVSSATRRTSGLSTEPTVIDTLNEIACAGSEEERSSSRKGSTVSTATGRTSVFSTVPTLSNNLNTIVSASSEEETSSRKGSEFSAAHGRPAPSPMVSRVSGVPFESENLLENVIINQDGGSSSGKGMVGSTGSRRTVTSPRESSRVSANPTESNNYLTNATTNLEDTSSSRKVSTVSTASRRTVPSPGGTSRVSTNATQPAVLADNISTLPDANETYSRFNGSTLSTSTKDSLGPWTGASSMISSKSNATQGVSSLRTEIGSLREASAISIAARFDNLVSAKKSASTVSLLSTVSTVETTENNRDPTPKYSNEMTPSQSRSDTTRRSFLPQLGINNFSPKSNPSDNVFGLHTITENPKAKDLAKPQPTASNSHPNDVSSLQKVSAASSVTRRSAGPQAGTSGLTALPRGIPVEIGYLQTESLENVSAVSTETGKSVGQKAGTRSVSTNSNAMANAIPVDIDGTLIKSPSPLQNESENSTDSRRSSTANYILDNVIVPMCIAATSCTRHHDNKCRECPGSKCSEILADNVSVHSEETPSSMKASAESTAFRQSVETSMPVNSKVSAATRKSPETSMVDHSKVSAATRQSLEISMAEHSKVSTTSRQSLDHSMPTNSKVSAATRQSLDHSMPTNSKVSAATRQSLETSMADHSKVSTASRQSLDHSMPTNSKVSAATRQSLETSMADHSKVSTTSRQPLDHSRPTNSKVSAATRQSLVTSMAEHSKVSAATRQSLETSMAEHSKVSAATKQSLAPLMAEHSKVSAATRQSLDPLRAANSNFSAANSNVSAAVESKGPATHCSGMASNATSPTNSSLIVGYIASTDEMLSQPNSNYLNFAAEGTSSFVSTSHQAEESPSSVDSSVTTYQSTPFASANEPNTHVDWRNATQLGYIAQGSNATPVGSTATRITVSPETDQRSSPCSGKSVIPLESLHFPDGAVSSTYSAAISKASKKYASSSPATRLSTNANETVISKGQLSVRPGDGRSIAKVSAVSAAGQQLSQAQPSVSVKSNTIPPDAHLDVANANVNPSMHASGVSSSANKGSISPREARRLSIKRNSMSQEIETGNISEPSQVAVLPSAMKQCPAISGAALKSLPQKVTSFHPPIAGNENVEASLQTIYKGEEDVQPSITVFQPRNDMHQCEEDKKCLSLAATQAEFDAFYGLERTESYRCTISIPSSSPAPDDSLACCDVIPCTSSEFVATTLAAMGKTPSNFSELSCLERSLQSGSTPPAIGVNLEDSSDKSDSLIYLDELCLTGDPEIDEEIIAFYKSRNCAGSRDS